MSKFLPIGTKGELLNSDMIARIIPKEDGGCIILTKDGQHFHSEIDLHGAASPVCRPAACHHKMRISSLSPSFSLSIECFLSAMP